MIYYITEGEYSDFSICAVFEGPRGINMKDVSTRYKEKFPDRVAKSHAYLRDGTIMLEEKHVIEFLQSEYGLTPVEAEEIHIGAYGKVGNE